MNEKIIEQIKYWFFVAVKDCGQWAEETFPKATPKSILEHLKEEYNELDEAVNNIGLCVGSNNISEEMADICLLIFHLAYKENIDLGKAIMDKFEKNRKRIWETETNEKGYFKHIEKAADNLSSASKITCDFETAVNNLSVKTEEENNMDNLVDGLNSTDNKNKIYVEVIGIEGPEKRRLISSFVNEEGANIYIDGVKKYGNNIISCKIVCLEPNEIKEIEERFTKRKHIEEEI